MFWNTWKCGSNDFIDRDQITMLQCWPRSVFATESISFLPQLESHYQHLGLGETESNTGARVTRSHNIHDHSDSDTQAVLCHDLRVSRAEKMMLLNAGDSEQHGQFPRCIIRGFVLNETSELRHVTRGTVRRGNVTSWGTDRLDAYISHWLTSAVAWWEHSYNW